MDNNVETKSGQDTNDVNLYSAPEPSPVSPQPAVQGARQNAAPNQGYANPAAGAYGAPPVNAQGVPAPVPASQVYGSVPGPGGQAYGQQPVQPVYARQGDPGSFIKKLYGDNGAIVCKVLKILSYILFALAPLTLLLGLIYFFIQLVGYSSSAYMAFSSLGGTITSAVAFVVQGAVLIGLIKIIEHLAVIRKNSEKTK